MLFLSMALAHAVTPTPAKFDLLCTAVASGRIERWVFSIDQNKKSYAGNQDDATSIGGTASVTPERIILVNEQRQLTWYYHINRASGEFTIAGGLKGRDRVFNQVRGTCHTFSGTNS